MQRLSSIIDKNEIETFFRGQTQKSPITHSYVINQLDSMNMVVADDGFMVTGVWGANPASDQFRLPFIDFRQVHVKPTFRMAFRTQRCIIVADSYYTWKESMRNPIRILLSEGMMFMPAIYFKTQSNIYGFTIITRPVRKSLRDHADFEPLLFSHERARNWLDFLPVSQVIKTLQTTLPIPFETHVVSQKIFVKGFNSKVLHQREQSQPSLF
jgi:putative SOS response-associated peptidase YedK